MAKRTKKTVRRGINNAELINIDEVSQLQAAFPHWLGKNYVNPDTAQTFSAVYRAVRLIAGTISMLPLRVYRDSSDGTPELVVDSPEAVILDSDMSAETTNIVFMDRLIQDVLLAGDGISVVVPRRDGTPSGMLFIPRERCSIWRRDNGSVIYTCTLDNGRQIHVERDMVVHVPGVGFNGLHGKSVINYGANSVITAINADTYSQEFFDNGSAPLGYIGFDKPIKETTAQIIREYWETQYKGIGNRNRTAIIPDGGKWNPINIKPVDAQLIESRRYQVADIARFFGVPLHLLQESNGSGGWVNGLEQQNLAFLIYTLMPFMERITQAFDRALLPDGYWCEFDMRLLTRGDTKSRYEAYQIALGGNRMPGWLTINEVRKLENMPPVENGDSVYIPKEDSTDEKQASSTDSSEPEAGNPEQNRNLDSRQDAEPTD